MKSLSKLAAISLTALAITSPVNAAIITFDIATPAFSNTISGLTSSTYFSQGYEFVVSQNKLDFYGGTGPLPHPLLSSWSGGLSAEAVNLTPNVGNNTYGPALITLTRVDGGIFDVTDFSFGVPGNTAVTGAALEVTPILNGTDNPNSPFMFDASGYNGKYSYGSPFTSPLTGADTYQFSLFTNFILETLTVHDASAGSPAVVPVPGGGAILLLGLGFMGFIAGKKQNIFSSSL